MTRPLKDDHQLETYKSLVTLSVEAFKFGALANGGAAVALLAYLGNVATKTLPVPDMRWPMGLFVTGLLLIGFAMVAAYWTQLRLYQEGRDGPALRDLHGWLLGIAATLFLLSLAAFGIGAMCAVVLFK